MEIFFEKKQKKCAGREKGHKKTLSNIATRQGQNKKQTL
jgi:hypothetical protein